jgi:hypothetical protein
MENNEKLDGALKALENGLKFIETNGKGGSDGVQYWSLTPDLAPQLLVLAIERGREADFWDRVAKGFNNLLKTSQTVFNDGSREDTLEKEEKLKNATSWIEKLFTVTESQATVMKKKQNDAGAIVAQIDEAVASGNVELQASLQEELNNLMRAALAK